ncbi:MAG: hypothetical protein HWD92_03260 [Flavobacteriia bacterium]|nr:hypothetical protein [Flavobacteriia bacterium]
MRLYLPLLLLATLLFSCEDESDEEVVTLEKQWDVQLLSETNVTAGGDTTYNVQSSISGAFQLEFTPQDIYNRYENYGATPTHSLYYSVFGSTLYMETGAGDTSVWNVPVLTTTNMEITRVIVSSNATFYQTYTFVER